MVYSGSVQSSFAGAFPANTQLLSQFYVGDETAPKGYNIIFFDSPIGSLTRIAFQPYNPSGAGGTYVQALAAYGDGDVLLANASATVAPQGSMPFLSVMGPGITFIEVSVSRAEAGFVWGSYAPEPATWALMIAGFSSVGAMIRRRRRAVA